MKYAYLLGALLATLVLGPAYYFEHQKVLRLEAQLASEQQRWQWLQQGESASITIFKDGATLGYDYKDGTATGPSVMTKAEHERMSFDMKRQMDAWDKYRDSYLYAANSKRELSAYLRTLADSDPALLVTIGILDENRDRYRPVTEKDLCRPK